MIIKAIKKINLNALIWAGILYLYAYLLFDLMNSGDIQLYLHPKMLPYVIFAWSVIVVLGLYQTTRIIKPSKLKKIQKGYILFLIPLLLAFTVNPKGVSIQMVENKGVYTISKTSLKQDIERGKFNPPIFDNDTTYEVVNFMDVLKEMTYSPQYYDDKTIKLTGFYYREASYETDAFMIARLLVSCCAADAQVAGFNCIWEEGDALEQGKWYEIEGVVRVETVYNDLFKMDETHAVIEVTGAVEVDEPANPYIYP